MLATWAGGRPFHKAKGEGGRVIGGGVVKIDVEIDVEIDVKIDVAHDYQAGAPEKLPSRVEIAGQGRARKAVKGGK
jgi:hypothetical protein